MKSISILLFALFTCLAQAETKFKMNFNNEELTKIIEKYAKASGQKFVVDPAVRGKVSIFLPDEVTTEEAFNQLSSALAVNGYAISKQGDTMLIKPARNIQRDLIEVTTEKPTLKPERIISWVYTVKNLPANTILRELRMLPSKDGEMSISSSTNQLIFTDWASNLNRISDILKEVDKPIDKATAKLVEAGKQERKGRHAEGSKKFAPSESN